MSTSGSDSCYLLSLVNHYSHMMYDGQPAKSVRWYYGLLPHFQLALVARIQYNLQGTVALGAQTQRILRGIVALRARAQRNLRGIVALGARMQRNSLVIVSLGA